MEAVSSSQWSCPKCTFLNKKANKRCSICDSRDPSASGRNIVVANKAVGQNHFNGSISPTDDLQGQSSVTTLKHSLLNGARVFPDDTMKHACRNEEANLNLNSHDNIYGKNTGSDIIDKRLDRGTPAAASCHKSSKCADQDLALTKVPEGEAGAREKRRAASGPWGCSVCSFHNPFLASSCEICFTPRSSTRYDVEHKLQQNASVVRRGHNAQILKNERQEFKLHAYLKTLAREASLQSVVAAKSESEAKKLGRPRKQQGSSVGTPQVEQLCPQKVVGSSQEKFPKSQLLPGMLIRYTFQTLEKEWDWYRGIIVEGWRSKSAWFNVMFEDGEQLWVYLDRASHGSMWTSIETGDELISEIAQFERDLRAAYPGALKKLTAGLEASCKEQPQISRKRSKKELQELERASSANIEVVDELSIEACPAPPLDWSHPPSVNSLEPTEVSMSPSIPRNTFASSVDLPVSRKKRKNHQRDAVAPDLPPAYLATETNPNKKSIQRSKQKVNLRTLANGEEYAFLQTNKLANILGLRKTRLPILPHPVAEVTEPIKDHWVACDRCQKWRRVSFEASKLIEASEEEWFCELNTSDQAHSFCDAGEEEEEEDQVPSSVAELDVEPAVGLEVESEEGVEADSEVATQRPTWTLALEQAYLLAETAHRSPSGYEVMTHIRLIIKNSLKMVGSKRTRWREFLERIEGCRSVSQYYQQLRMIIFGCRRSSGPLPPLKASARSVYVPVATLPSLDFQLQQPQQSSSIVASDARHTAPAPAAAAAAAAAVWTGHHSAQQGSQQAPHQQAPRHGGNVYPLESTQQLGGGSCDEGAFLASVSGAQTPVQLPAQLPAPNW